MTFRGCVPILLLCSSCAVVEDPLEQRCGMAIVHQTSPIAINGDIRLKWRVVPQQELHGYCAGKENLYGCAFVYDDFTQIFLAKSERYSPSCDALKFIHEFEHALGRGHS